MPVEITDIDITNELRAESVDWLLANVGDKIAIELKVKVETSVVASTDNTLTMNNVDGYIPVAGSEWITDDSARFVDFRVGDLVRISEYNPVLFVATLTIVEKLDDSTIRVSGSTGYAVNTVVNRIVISVANPITALRYKWNFIENLEATNFFSKIDGSEQVLKVDTIDASVTTPLNMDFLGNLSYQIGYATAEGVSIDTSTGVYVSKFIIKHYTFLTPFVLATQLSNLQSLTAPDYFFNGAALKAIFDVEAMYQFTDPNRIQTIELTEVQGNTGWFNENFDTGVTGYELDSKTYTDPLAVVIPAIQLSTAETDVEIVIKNPTDAPFVNGSTKFVLNFSRIPENTADYQLNGQTIIENFFFDRALQTVGSAAVNGENFGTGQQVLKTISALFVSSSEIKITCKIAMVANVVDTITATDAHEYMLWVAIQDHTLPTKDADKVALLVDAQDFYENTTDPTMVITTNSFLRHPFTDVNTETDAAINMFPNDDPCGYSLFYLDRTGRTADDISFRSVQIELKAYNVTTQEEFTLEIFSFDMSSLPVINNNQYVDFSLDRQFHVPAGEVRKTIRVRRRTDLDTASFFYYDVIYPYLTRWEYWVLLQNVNGAFFNISQPLNGFNNFWYRYSTVADWGFAYETTIRATKNSALQTYRTQTLLGMADFNSNPDWLPATIKSYDDATNTVLLSGGTRYILGYAATRIEAEFTKISSPPALGDIRMVMWIEVYEEGGIAGSRRISSVYQYDSDTWFKSTDASKMIVLSLAGNTVKGKCLIDHTVIPLDKQQFKVTARIYELGAAGTDSKLFQDGDDFIFQDGDTYLFQDQ